MYDRIKTFDFVYALNLDPPSMCFFCEVKARSTKLNSFGVGLERWLVATLDLLMDFHMVVGKIITKLLKLNILPTLLLLLFGWLQPYVSSVRLDKIYKTQ